MQNKTVSVITVVFNGAKEIERTIQNILAQTHPFIELIIVDGGSTDGTQAIIEKYSGHISRFVSEKDEGIYDAMNKGVALATGRWVNFMNCGDGYASEKTIENIIAFAQPGDEFIYGDYIADYGHNGQRFIKAGKPVAPHLMVLSHQSVFATRDLLCKYPFDTHLKICSDPRFYEECWHHKHMFRYYPHAVSVRSHAGLSDRNRTQAFRESEQVLLSFYPRQYVTARMQRIRMMHLLKHGSKKILPSFLQRMYRKWM